MKALLPAALALALLTLAAGTAQAQQAGSVTIHLQAPAEPLVDGSPLTFVGTVTITADWTVVTGLVGIPVTYTITRQPEWATVTVSPASDVFTVGPPAGLQTAYVGTRTITITVTLTEEKAEDATGLVEVAATTTASPLGRSLTGKGAAPIAYDAPEEPCPEHEGMTHEQMAAMALEAADAYDAYQEQARPDDAEDVSVQSAGASPVPMPWIAVGGLALAGAGVGLLLRRRFG